MAKFRILSARELPVLIDDLMRTEAWQFYVANTIWAAAKGTLKKFTANCYSDIARPKQHTVKYKHRTSAQIKDDLRQKLLSYMESDT